MTYDEMLQQRLQALLRTIRTDTTSDLLIAEYERISRQLHAEYQRLEEERKWK